MGRAIGINAVMAGAVESPYGAVPASGFFKLPMVTHALGEEQPLIEDDQLGFGREGLDPTYDVITNDGDLVVPCDIRAIGFWLRQTFGPPSTSVGGTAAGSWTFTGQPGNNSTINVNGTLFTFVTGAPSGNQIQIGANLAATLTNAATALNGSAVSGVAQATYTSTATKLTATNDTAGPTGNAFTMTASADSNGSVSGATLTGGTNIHVFTSGAPSLPSTSIEIGNPDVPSYSMNYGAVVNQLKISLARSGMLNATLSMIAQGEADPTIASVAGMLTALAGPRFAQATGSISSDGAVLGNVVSADFTYSNNLDKVEVIREDGRIAGADPGKAMTSGALSIRFADQVMLNKARSKLPMSLSYGWKNAGNSLVFAMPRVFLPKPKRSITGPKGIMADFNWQASGALAAQLTATLSNDVASYA